MSQLSKPIYQLKVVLNGARPPIWRRLLVASDTTLPELHNVIQIAMGWTDSHLHQFIVGRRRYREPDPDFDDDAIDEHDVPIRSLLKKEKEWLLYEYDFGDGWEHRVTLEKVIRKDEGEFVPRCVGGRRGCPPEDVGGIYGYVQFLQAYEDKNHPEHREVVEWAGEYFHPERFDMEEVNAILADIKKRA